MPFLRNIGPLELIILLVILALIFGAGRLADLGGALGKSIREFRKETTKTEQEPVEAEKHQGDEKPAS